MDNSLSINLIQCDDGCLRRFAALLQEWSHTYTEKAVYSHWKGGGAHFLAIPVYVYPPLPFFDFEKLKITNSTVSQKEKPVQDGLSTIRWTRMFTNHPKVIST